MNACWMRRLETLDLRMEKVGEEVVVEEVVVDMTSATAAAAAAVPTHQHSSLSTSANI